MLKLKKVSMSILAMLMTFSMVACNGASTENTTATPAATASMPDTATPDNTAGEETSQTSSNGLKYLTEGQKYPEKTVKIGVPQYDATDSSAIAFRTYFDYISQYLNVEFVYSEALESAEDEIAFIENCYIAGCQAIMGTYDVIGHTVIDMCAEYGMYYLLGPSDIALMEGELYEKYKTNEYWVGGITQGNVNYEAGRAVAQYLIDNNVTKACYASGGAAFGVEMFVRGREGFYDTINASGTDIEIVELVGFPNDEWFATQATILADPDIQAVSGLATPNFWAQPITAAGRSDILLVSASGALDDTNLNALKDGTLDFTCINGVEEHALNIIMLLNALNGDMDMVKPDGNTMLIDANIWIADNYEYAETLYELISGPEHIIDINDFCSLIKDLNPDAKFDDIYTVMSTTDIPTILSRHEANRQ